MQIDFDPAKDAANQAKHGVSLAFGAAILADPDRVDALDVRHIEVEERFVSYGKVDGRIWVCVFAMRGDRCRIISVRKANDREARRYDEAH